MKVFISWSGPVSQAVAEVLRKYLPCVLQAVRPFVSSHDLESGVRWSVELAKELDETQFGIICLTPDNLHSDSILFEAGALTKHVDGRACCLLLQNLKPADVSWPLAQFQNCTFGRDQIAKLFLDINVLLDSPLSEPKLHLIFDQWWPRIEQEAQAAQANLPAPSDARREPSDMLEEIVLRMRRLQARLDQVTPSISISVVDASTGTTSPEQSDDGEYFTVSLGRIRAGGPELRVRTDPFTTFQMLLDQLYKFVAGYVPPSSYGTFWVLRDVASGSMVTHARMQVPGAGQPRVKDYRKLTDVGIQPGVKLEAVRLDEYPAA